MIDNENKRHYERQGLGQALMLEKWAQERRPAPNVHFEVQGIDISSGGIGIATSQALSIGEVVKVEYPLNDSGVTVPVYSEVVWTRMAGGAARVGLRFLM
jgi:hypothetical protein